MAEIDWASPKTGDETDWASPKVEAAPARADVMGAPAAALTGLAHGISSGTGWLSRTAKRALFPPGELEDLEQGYQQARKESPKTTAVADFIGGMYTPENAAAGQVVGAGVGAGLKAAAGPVGRFLESIGIKQGRRVLTGGANPLAVKRPISEDAVRAAFDAGAIAPGRTTEFAAGRLKTARGEAGQALSDIISKLEQGGVKGPAVDPLAQALEAKAAALEATSVDSEAPALYRKIADEIRSKSPGGHLGLAQSESIKQGVQGKIDYEAMRKATDMVKARKDIASILRQAGEDAVTSGTSGNALSDLGGQFVPAKDVAGNLIEASQAANKGAAQAARRNMFGLRSMLAGTGAATAATQAFGPTIGAVAGPATVLAQHVLETRGTPTAAAALYKLGGALGAAGQRGGGPGISKVVGPFIAAETPSLWGQVGAHVAPAFSDTESAAATPAPSGSESPTSWRDASPIDAFRRVVSKSDAHPAMSGANTEGR